MLDSKKKLLYGIEMDIAEVKGSIKGLENLYDDCSKALRILRAENRSESESERSSLSEEAMYKKSQIVGRIDALNKKLRALTKHLSDARNVLEE